MTALNSQELNDYCDIALLLAQKGASVLLNHWGNIKKVQNKEGVGNLVTNADKESEQKILELLHKYCPGHSILIEESGMHQAQNHDFVWMIDPLDGTTNYVHQYPLVAVSIALIHLGEPILGVIFNPFLHELFQAKKGTGATLNGVLIQVSSTKKVQKSLLASGFAYDRCECEDNNYAEFCALTSLSEGVRRGGSAALDLAYVAAGRFDGYWERGIKPWDIAAGALLVAEAGGVVSAYDTSKLDLYSERILATNGYIHSQLSEELLKIKNK